MSTILQSYSRNLLSRKGFAFLVASFIIPTVFAGVIVLPSGNINTISADKARNAQAPMFSALDAIIIKEAKATDFAPGMGKFTTLCLTAPAGWMFNPNVGSATKKTGDLRSLRMQVTANTIALTFISSGISYLDMISISGIEVQATDGAAINCAANIYRSLANPGTAKIAGIIATASPDGSGGTAFCSLQQSVGIASTLGFATRPGQCVAGTNFEQQVTVITQDQFGNPSATGLLQVQMVKINLSAGNGTLSGEVLLNIGTDGGNGIASTSNLRINATGPKRLMASSAGLSFAVTNEFMVTEDEGSSNVSMEDNPDWVCHNDHSLNYHAVGFLNMP